MVVKQSYFIVRLTPSASLRTGQGRPLKSYKFWKPFDPVCRQAGVLKVTILDFIIKQP